MGGATIVDSRELALACAQIADGKKAEDIVVLDLQKVSMVSDFFVIASGGSAKQLQAIADALRERFKEEGLGKGTCEGYEAGAWILLEAADVVVHLFRHEMRRFYDLESLWGEAKPVAWKKRGSGAAAARETGTGP